MFLRKARKKNFIKFFIFIFLFIILLNQLYSKLFFYDDFIDEIHSRGFKSVQLLTGRFDFYNWELGEELGEKPFENCLENKCFLFKSTYLVQRPAEKSDAVVVHGPNLWYMPNKRLYKRNPRQLWLFYTMEPQGLTFCSSHFNLTDLDDWFNLTASFKHDSDIFVDYKQFRDWSDVQFDLDYINMYKKLSSDPILNLNNLKIKNQKTVVVWFVSHCETYSRRELYVKELMKYINVDIYGSCGKYFNSHSIKDPCGSKKNLKCFNKLLNSYKFYLAFENSLCEDYITEKYWKLYDSNKIFEINILPVVRGARDKDYTRETKIENFFINTEKFSSPKDLANYLNYLNSNDSAYLEYFKWKFDLYKSISFNLKSNQSLFREHYNVSTYYHLREPFCKLCSYLHNQTYLNSKTNKKWFISEWFNKRTNCWDYDEDRKYLQQFLKFFGFCF